MKIIAYKRGLEDPVTIPPVIDVIPDSAITVANRPLFLPDFSREWTGIVCPAFRISRLGKEISRKFACRYYDAVTLALRIHPADMARGAIESVFDSCVTLGEWLPLADLKPTASDRFGEVGKSAGVNDADKEGGAQMVVEYDGLSLPISPRQLDIDGAIESISHYATLKTGDIILPCVLPAVFPLKADTPVTATLNSHHFTVKVK